MRVKFSKGKLYIFVLIDNLYIDLVKENSTFREKAKDILCTKVEGTKPPKLIMP